MFDGVIHHQPYNMLEMHFIQFEKHYQKPVEHIVGNGAASVNITLLRSNSDNYGRDVLCLKLYIFKLPTVPRERL